MKNGRNPSGHGSRSSGAKRPRARPAEPERALRRFSAEQLAAFDAALRRAFDLRPGVTIVAADTLDKYSLSLTLDDGSVVIRRPPVPSWTEWATTDWMYSDARMGLMLSLWRAQGVLDERADVIDRWLRRRERKR